MLAMLRSRPASWLTPRLRTARQFVSTRRFAVARANLGYVLNEQGKLKDAEATLMLAAELDPRNPRTYYNLGLNLQRQGKNGRAVEAYRQAIKLNPDYAEALNNYGNTLTALGRFELARSKRSTTPSSFDRDMRVLITIAAFSSISCAGLTKPRKATAGQSNVSRIGRIPTSRLPTT